MDKTTVFTPDKLIKTMKKAGNTPITSRDELKPPAWLALAQLLFAAVLLYVIRNPVSLQSASAIVLKNKPVAPAIVINIPLSTVAVAAPVKQRPSELPM